MRRRRNIKPLEKNPLWLDVIKAAPPILWVLLAFIAFFEIGPEVWRLVRVGAITKIGIGVVNLEVAQKRLNEVKGLDAAGIPPSVQAQLKRRFANVVDTANEVRLLWVDDQHPYQNLRDTRS
jgi:hypothetical protein